MWASVNWDPVQFVRQLPWLALEPPPPTYGLKILPPLSEGGWWLIAGFFLTDVDHAVVGRTLPRARALGIGHPHAWAFASAIWLYLVLGFIRPLLMGLVVARRSPSASSRISIGRRRSRSATATCSTTRSTCSRSCSSTDRRCCSRCMAGTILACSPLRRRARDRADRRPRHSRRARRPVLALDDGLQRHDGIDPSLGLVVRRAVPAGRRHRHPAHRHRRRQLVPLGRQAWCRALATRRSTARSSIPPISRRAAATGQAMRRPS